VGPLALTGLICLGAAIGLGLLASRARPVADPADAPRVRATLTVAAAFVQSLGVLAVVVGLLAVELGAAGGQPSAVAVAGLALAGTLIGIALIARHAGRVDPQAALLGAMFTIGLGTLGAVVGIMAVVIDERGTNHVPDWPFIVLGLIGGSCALVMGWFGGRAMDAAAVDRPDLVAIQSALTRRCLPLLAVGVGAIGLAVLTVIGGGS
jgi:hypothetical protein